jgi:uncharacterized protein
MNHRLARVSPAFFALVLASTARAQTPASPGKPAPAPKPAATAAPLSPAKAAAVGELFTAMKLQAEVQTMPEAMVDGEIARNPGLTPYRDLMLNWLKKSMTWQAMQPELTQLYGEAFTEPELKEMAAFYRTPTGQKALHRMPEMMQRSMMIGAKVSQPHTEELRKQMQAREAELAKKQQGGAAPGGGKPPAPAPTAPPKKP